MSKKITPTLLIFVALLFLSACKGENTTMNVVNTDKSSNILDYEQRTLDQAKALKESLKKSFNGELSLSE